MEVFQCEYSPTRTVYLIDTPGFDDTFLSDAEILHDLSAWLVATYSNHIRLNVIFYLNRITDVRVAGSARHNLKMFQKLCGSDELRNVILVTTMWDQVQENYGIQRETELKNTLDLWGYMVSCGSRIERHTGDQASAHRLVGMFVNPNSQSEQVYMSLAIQKEILDDNRKLHETNAATEVREFMEEHMQKHVKKADMLKQDLLQTQRELNDAWRRDFDMLGNDIHRHKEDSQFALEKLAADMKQLIEYAFEHNMMESRAEKEERVAEQYKETPRNYARQFSSRKPDPIVRGLPASQGIHSLPQRNHSRGSNIEDPKRPDLPTCQSNGPLSSPLSRYNNRPGLLRFQKMSHSRHSVGSHWPKRTHRDLSLSLRGHHCSFVGPAHSKSYV